MDIEVETQAENPAEETFDRDALEASVSKGLEAMVDSDPDVELDPVTTEPVEPEPTETDPVTTEPGPLDPTDPTDPTDPIDPTDPTDPIDPTEPTEEVSTGESAVEQQPDPKGSAPTFPAAWRRTMHAYDWTDDEIADAMSQEPNARASFMATAQKLHANRNAELAKWADMGRRERDARPDPTMEPSKARVDSETGKFAPSNIDALVEKYGNEDLIREIAEPFNDMVAQINAVMPELVSGVQSIRESREQALAREIDQFFGSADLQTYSEVYGVDSAALSDDQVGTRNKVLEFADALIAGASLQGKKLSVGESLTLAHDSVSGAFKEKAIRTEIKKSIKARSKGISLKPTGKSPQKAGPKTRDELEKDTRARLTAVFSS